VYPEEVACRSTTTVLRRLSGAARFQLLIDCDGFIIDWQWPVGLVFKQKLLSPKAHLYNAGLTARLKRKMQTLPSHFDGKRFRSPQPRRGNFRDLLRWLLSRKPGPWRIWTDAKPVPRPPKTSERLRITFINHSTFLVQLDGLNILTDPIWSERASPISWAGPRRHRSPGIRLEDLPPIDLVLLSHDHYDHMDIPTLQWLAKAHRPTIYAGLKNRRVLKKHGIGNVVELDWWQEAAARSDIWITAVPAQHFSGRSPFTTDKTLWCGFMVQGNNGTVYFAGDTGTGPHLEQIAKRFPEIDLAILPIGAFRPEWFMGEVHMSPREAVQAHTQLSAQVSVASHFGTFHLADDGEDEPVEALLNALKGTHLGDTDFWVLGFGEGRDVPARPLTIRERSSMAR
jgi:L-ascorbate metabolism protein UlaG (beta-lactamase superfamily)